jgi:hypothetical protein
MPDHPPRTYVAPRVQRFGTFRQITREGLTGNLDGGLILGPDGNPTDAAAPQAVPDGSR